MKIAAISTIALLLGIAGCASPEATRTRGGQGADSGNRGKIVRIHEGAKPFDKTPNLIPTKHSPLESASQADQLSRK